MKICLVCLTDKFVPKCLTCPYTFQRFCKNKNKKFLVLSKKKVQLDRAIKFSFKNFMSKLFPSLACISALFNRITLILQVIFCSISNEFMLQGAWPASSYSSKRVNGITSRVLHHRQRPKYYFLGCYCPVQKAKRKSVTKS